MACDSAATHRIGTLFPDPLLLERAALCNLPLELLLGLLAVEHWPADDELCLCGRGLVDGLCLGVDVANASECSEEDEERAVGLLMKQGRVGGMK